MTLIRALIVILCALPLSGCFLSPGTFDSTLDINSDGSFAFAYRGQLVVNLPGESGSSALSGMPSVELDSGPMPCWDEQLEERPCTEEDLVEQRDREREYREAQQAAEAERNRQFSRIFAGIDLGDEETLRAFAQRLEGQAGWHSVEYAGDGVFNVDYRMNGRVEQGFIFPLIEGFQVMQPVVTIATRNDGNARVQAPGFATGNQSILAMLSDTEEGPSVESRGTFLIRTDGEVLTNNTQDGPTVSDGRSVLRWDIGAVARPSPETLVRLRR